jgi:hypothetical protein
MAGLEADRPHTYMISRWSQNNFTNIIIIVIMLIIIANTTTTTSGWENIYAE